MASDTAAFLAGSEDRARVLSYLDDQPAAPAAVASDLSVSRRSVQRHLAEFVERDWATRADGTYELTTVGELVADEHASYRDSLARIEEFGAFYGRLPDGAHAPDPRWLRDADLVVATDGDPHAPTHHYITRVREFDCERVRMLSPVLSRLFHDAHAELALDGVRTELVASDELIDRARERNPAEFDVVASVDVLDLYRHPGPVEFGVTLGERRVLLGAYDDGQLEACVESTDPELLAWAEECFERHRDRSDSVDAPLSLPFVLGDS